MVELNPFVALAVAGVGVALGPALRVEAFRLSVPTGTPVRSSCPGCGNAVFREGPSWRRFTDFRFGRCHHCGQRLGPPPAVVEVAAAASFGALALTVDQVLPLLAYCVMAALGITLAVVDVAVHRLPDRLTGLLVLCSMGILSVQAALTSAGGQLVEALAAGLGAGLFYSLTSLLTGGGVGLGDAKLAVGLGVAVGWSGWPAVLFATTLGLVSTGLVAIALLVVRGARRRDPIPHGPFMVTAAITTLALQHV